MSFPLLPSRLVRRAGYSERKVKTRAQTNQKPNQKPTGCFVFTAAFCSFVVFKQEKLSHTSVAFHCLHVVLV